MKPVLVALGATAAVTLGLIGNAPTAAAADGWCNDTTVVKKGAFSAILPATSGGSTSCLMSRGSSGDHVLALQHALQGCQGLDTGGLDGIYGAKTEAAVRTLQSRNGLSVDGVYGPSTRNVISWWWHNWTISDDRCARL
ncbi:peptidoglycan-binding domain-containing protein [Streptomyces sp. C]|uniref:peptidoglycan-binding domain-containing protein n=1 Tax=Streptomyces sp. C TaxID=253839 RepID=UPI0001B58740|nr:peptidoglycan-binding domain-containing protein [Streptomyces sp. C]EFL13481.1 predicted protein [Streptomyces sp. C]